MRKQDIIIQKQKTRRHKIKQISENMKGDQRTRSRTTAKELYCFKKKQLVQSDKSRRDLKNGHWTLQFSSPYDFGE